MTTPPRDQRSWRRAAACGGSRLGAVRCPALVARQEDAGTHRFGPAARSRGSASGPAAGTGPGCTHAHGANAVADVRGGLGRVASCASGLWARTSKTKASLSLKEIYHTIEGDTNLRKRKRTAARARTSRSGLSLHGICRIRRRRGHPRKPTSRCLESAAVALDPASIRLPARPSPQAPASTPRETRLANLTYVCQPNPRHHPLTKRE